MEENKTKELGSDVNRSKFVLVTNTDAKIEDYGWTEDYVEGLLYIEANDPDDECMGDADTLNNLGIIFCDGVGADIDMKRAIKYYSKGTNGVPRDYAKAYELYKSCRIPYAFYRVGEALEYGRGVAQDTEKAKQYYRVAYREGHPLARRKLQTLNFLE